MDFVIFGCKSGDSIEWYVYKNRMRNSNTIVEIGDYKRKGDLIMKIIRKSSKKRVVCMNCSPASAMQY